jgi:quercetin dioxygenase-like cupin family protein
MYKVGISDCQRPYRHRLDGQGIVVSAARVGTGRRIVVGEDAAGRSAVRSDGPSPAVVEKPGTLRIEELWRQESLPATPSDDGTRAELVGVLPPGGAVVRTYVLFPGHTVDPLHRTEALHVITVVAGALRVLLDDGTAELAAGDTLVLPGANHTLENAGEVPAELVYTGFPLQR